MKKVISFPTQQLLKEKNISQGLDEFLNVIGIYDEKLRVLLKKELRDIAKIFNFTCPKISDSTLDENQVRLVTAYVKDTVIPGFIEQIGDIIYVYMLIRVREIEKEYYDK